MQRRTWLLFGLFVAIAIFYAQVGDKTVDIAASGQAKQLKALEEAELRALGVSEADDGALDKKAQAESDSS